MPRYVILQHDWNGMHYDLMLEQRDVLRTWRLAVAIQPGTHQVVQLPDHRLEYLSYEGPVSGGRGDVRRFAEGVYELTAITGSSIEVVLQGTLQGSLTLQHESNDRWQLKWCPRS